VAMAAVLLPYGLWLPPALLVSTLPAFYVVLRASRRYHTWWNAETITRRRIQYFDVLLTDPFHAGELRLFGLAPRFRRAYQMLRTHFRTDRLNLLKEQYWSRLGAEVVALAVSGAAMLWMFYRAFLGLVTLGDLALFFQAFQRGQGLVRTLLGNLGQIYTDSLYVGNLFEFLGLQSHVVDAPEAIPAPANLQSGIRFENVTFCYPGRSSPSLRNFSAFIPAGKIVAIVGENGAVKTTALKLVSRFYDPQSGHVELDGIDVRRLSLHSLRKGLTFMFQTPGSYQFTARENIVLGNLDAEGDDSRVEHAAWSAGAHDIVRRLPNGYDSQLGRWFPGGSDLSGGEWQRLALARAFIRQAPIMLLDEPTSSMDSWAEADWFNRLRKLADGRTVVLVTHRLTIAMRADLIYVMKNGEVVESGNHEQLLALGGLYSKSWRAQVQSTPDVPDLQATMDVV
jgi:ATP-binding cassette subfamily B protein